MRDGEQGIFLEQALNKISLKSLALICNCSERTIRDWKREKFKMSLASLLAITHATRLPTPYHETRDRFDHTSNAGRKGGEETIRKYGRVPSDASLRQKNWQLWWEKEGRFKEQSILKSITIHAPEKSPILAEFIGIMLGDGGMSKYQATISLHRIDDAEYSLYVVALIIKLFAVVPRVTDRSNALVRVIVISRIELVRFLYSLGLPIGNKIRQGVDIPRWIMHTRSFRIACVRGLIDTDGCIFKHRYKVKGKWYEYPKISFTSASPSLIHSVHKVLSQESITARKTRSGKDIFIESKVDVERYMKLFSSNNPKHLKRYENSRTMR